MKTFCILLLSILAFAGCSTNDTAYNNRENFRILAEAKSDRTRPPLIVHSEAPVCPVGPRVFHDKYKEKCKENYELRAVLGLEVDEQGMPQNIHIIESTDAFYNSVFLECMAKWRYKPAVVDGVPVRCKIRQTMTITIYTRRKSPIQFGL
jgi:hypothetical protein